MSVEDMSQHQSEINESKKTLNFSDLPKRDRLNLGDLTEEHWREYDFGNRVYRIENPIGVYWRNGGSTHRVVDNKGLIHCVPAPGVNGCVLRWHSGIALPVKW